MAFPDNLTATQGTLRPETSPDDEKARDALDLVAQLRKDFKPRDDLYSAIDSVLFLLNAVEIPEAYKKTTIEIHNPLPIHITNNITAALSINLPDYGFKATGLGQSSEDNAALRREFFKASWSRQEQEANARIFRRFIHALVTKGEAIIKTVERRKTAWAGYSGYSKKVRGELDATSGDYYGLDSSSKDKIYNQKTEEWKRGAPYPITSIDVPPDSFYYIKGENGFTFCAECKAIPYYDAFVKYGIGVDKKGKIVPQAMGMPMSESARNLTRYDTSMITMVEVWDWRECMYILQGPGDTSNTKSMPGGMLVKRLKHNYGNPELKTLRGPYFHCFGITTSSRDVDKQGLGILFGFLDLFTLLDSLLTIQSNAAFAFGFPTFRRVKNSGLGPVETPFGKDAMDNAAEMQDLVPGTVFPDNIEPIDMPHTGIDLDKTIAAVRNLIEMAHPSAASGQLSGDESGYAVNQAAHMAKLQWNPMIENAEFALAQRVSFESWLIENRIKETVYVDDVAAAFAPKKMKGTRDKGWLCIGPKDLNGLHRYSARLNPETPANEMIELRKHQMKLEMRIESPEDAVEAFGNNPSDVERAWLLKAIKQDPAIFEQMKQMVFKALATIDQQALGGTPPPNAAPSQFAPTPQGALVPGIGGTPFTQNPAQQVGVNPGNQMPGPPGGTPAGQAGMPPSNAMPIPGGGPG